MRVTPTLQAVNLPRSSAASAPRIAGVLCFALALAGCNTYNDVMGSINPAVPAVASGGAQGSLQDLARRYAAAPNDQAVAMSYAKALRGSKQYAQAAAILESVAIRNPDNLDVLGAYGKALADAGRLQEAARVLANAQTPQRPNWSILSAQGSVADQLGDHDSAQGYYHAALKIVPGEPSVLSNLGLSYALSKKLPEAEEALRRAAADPRADARVRQNLALVLALRGKFAEAESVGRKDLSPQQAAANVSAIRSMIAQSNTWRQIQETDAPAKKNAASKLAPG